jgi:hypothetical protein
VEQAVHNVRPLDMALLPDVGSVPPSSVCTEATGAKASDKCGIVLFDGEFSVNSLHAQASTGDAPGEEAHDSVVEALAELSFPPRLVLRFVVV